MTSSAMIESKQSRRERSSAMDSDIDFPLVEAIAQRRDREAFAELFQRHQRAAQSVASMIAGRREEAEEAVQEAMLRIWQSAATFHPQEGANVRSWLLRVVAHESLRILRKRKRVRKEVPAEKGVLEMQPAAEEVGDAVKYDETLVELRAALLRLSEPERQVVALAYGAGMRHHEIAEVLKIPRSTISNHLQKTLQVLRADLTASGFTAAIPLLTEDGLGEAICQGCDAPLDLQARILNRLPEEGGVQAQTLSRRAAVLKPAASSWLAPAPVVGAMLAVGAAGALWWSHSRQPIQVDALPPAEPPKRVAQPQPTIGSGALDSVPAPTERWQRRWSFEKGIPKDIQVTGGKWRLTQNAKDKSIAVATERGADLLLKLPVPERAAPHLLEVRVSFLPVLEGEGAKMRILLGDGEGTYPMRLWRDPHASRWISKEDTQVVRAFFDGKDCLTFYNGNLISAACLNSKPAKLAVHLRATHAVLLSAEYSELDPQALPVEFRDVWRTIELLEKSGAEPLDVGIQSLLSL